MSEIIPLKKDIVFKTKIGEITNINLDYDYKINDDLVEGSVDISGSYKMLETSVLEEDFFYSIPFSVAISNNVLKESIRIEIDDFKYSFNKDVLNVNIDLSLDCEHEENEILNNENLISNMDLNINSFDNEITINDSIIENEIDVQNDVKENNINISNNIFNFEDKYYTYRVYIVKPNDTLETISNKYNISVDDIKINNPELDLNINVGDKIIIPEYEE